MYLALTIFGDGFWLLADQRRFEALPAQHQSIIAKNINEAAIKQRADVERLEAELQLELVARGLQFNDIIDTIEFRSKLSRSNFYRKWKEHLQEMERAFWNRCVDVLGNYTR